MVWVVDALQPEKDVLAIQHGATKQDGSVFSTASPSTCWAVIGDTNTRTVGGGTEDLLPSQLGSVLRLSGSGTLNFPSPAALKAHFFKGSGQLIAGTRMEVLVINDNGSSAVTLALGGNYTNVLAGTISFAATRGYLLHVLFTSETAGYICAV